MLKQSVKDVYFALNRWLVLPATGLQKLRFRNRRNLYIHLGCGDDYRQEMINVDGNITRRKDMWLDLRNRLPFADGSVRLIYCCHMLEHLFPEDAVRLLREMCRVVADDGVVRLAVPGFQRCLEIAAGNDNSRWPREFDDPQAQAINYIFCDGQHKYAYCFANLKAFAEEAGFGCVRHTSAEHGVSPQTYDHLELGNEPRGSLVVELRRTSGQTSAG